MPKLFVSLFGAPQLTLEQTITSMQPQCDGFHLDVMDLHFVPNLALSPIMINELAQHIKKELFVHLMVENPEKILQTLSLPAGTIVSVHRSSTPDIHTLLNLICAQQWLPSIALSPEEPLDDAFSVIDHIKQVLVMSVEPGFSGQEFMPEMLEKVQLLNDYRTRHQKHFRIAMDGGINEKNIKTAINAGVDDIVIASAIFSKDDPLAALKELHAICQKKKS